MTVILPDEAEMAYPVNKLITRGINNIQRIATFAIYKTVSYIIMCPKNCNGFFRSLLHTGFAIRSPEPYTCISCLKWNLPICAVAAKPCFFGFEVAIKGCIHRRSVVFFLNYSTVCTCCYEIVFVLEFVLIRLKCYSFPFAAMSGSKRIRHQLQHILFMRRNKLLHRWWVHDMSKDRHHQLVLI